MLRAIVLSLALLVGIGTLLPLATEYAEAGSGKQRKYKKKKVKKYSKRWWRAYNKRKAIKRAKLRNARKARAARVRRAKLRRARVAKARRSKSTTRRSSTAKTRKSRAAKSNTVALMPNTFEMPADSPAAVNFVVAEEQTSKTTASSPKSVYKKTVAETQKAPAVLPSGNLAPTSWKSEGYSQGELQFRVNDNSGTTIGAAAISVIGPAVEESPMLAPRTKTVGGVTTTALRRTVIDQMIRENGWVVNDFQKEISGSQVYVVVAQAPGANNQVENRTFYFTEVEGKIYSVATKSSDSSLERIEEESEKVLASLQRKSMPTQVATNRTASNLVANEE